MAQGPHLRTCCHPHPHGMTEMSSFFPSDSFLFSPLASKDGLTPSHESLCLWPTRRLILSTGPDTSSRVSSRAHRRDRASYLESQQRLDLNRTQVLSLCFSVLKISFVLVVRAGTQLAECLSKLAECLPNTHEHWVCSPLQKSRDALRRWGLRDQKFKAFRMKFKASLGYTA